MSRGKILAGIDIGTCKITTVIISINEESGQLQVVGVANEPSRGLRKSQVVDIEEAVLAVTRSVEAAERMAGCSISSAFVSTGGSHIQSQNSKGVVAIANPNEEILQEDVGRVVEAARAISLPSSREILHVIPRDFIVDSQEGIKDPLNMTGIRLEVETHVVTGTATAMRNLAKCVTEVGIDVSGLVFTGLASAEAVLTDTEKELGVCLVDIGGGTTSLAVFVEGSLAYSAVVPIGAKNITNDMAIGIRVSLETAEKIKMGVSSHSKEELLAKSGKLGNNKDDINLKKIGVDEEIKKVSYKTLTEGIIKPRLNEIFNLVGEELQKSSYGAATPAGVVVTGGGAQTVGIIESCKRTLSLPVRIGKPQALTGLVDEIKDPDFAVAHGLMVYADRSGSGTKGSFPLSSLGKFIPRLPIKGLVNKASDFVKSFLP